MSPSAIKIIKDPHSLSVKFIVKQLNSNINTGLTNNEIKKRIDAFGKNEIPKEKPKTRWKILTDQFINSIIYILAIAALFAFIFKRLPTTKGKMMYASNN